MILVTAAARKHSIPQARGHKLTKDTVLTNISVLCPVMRFAAVLYCDLLCHAVLCSGNILAWNTEPMHQAGVRNTKA